jgi:hypothetical protein
MRNPPRIALVPLAVLVSIVPFTFSSFVGAAGADTVADCEIAFSAGPASGLTYTTNPGTRLAYVGQTVSLSGSWDPAAWDSLSSAAACVRVDDAFDDVLGAATPAPDNTGAFEHSFTIPDTVEPGTRLCTRIRLAGDPAGEATEAVWASKMHCFEVDHHEAEAPPSDDETTPTTAAPATTTSTAPTAAAGSSGSPADETPPSPIPASAEGGGAPGGTPFDSAGDVPGAATSPIPSTGAAPEELPLLPATGSASIDLLHRAELLVCSGLALLVLAGRLRRRQISRVTTGLS